MEDRKIGVAGGGAAYDLAEDERRFRLLADNAPVMIWRSGLDRRFNYINTGWREFTGRALQQEVGLGWTKGLQPEDYQRVLDTLHAAQAARLSFTTDFHLRRHDSDYRWLLCNGVPFYRDGDFAGFLGCCVDISTHQIEDEADSERRDTLLRQLNHRV